jgi:hypothetical protein
VNEPAPINVLMQAAHSQRASSGDPVTLFADIKIDMSRPSAELMLGSPVAADVERNGIVEVWYMPPPPVTKPNLPKDGLGSVFVAYKDGRVFEKRLNPQL